MAREITWESLTINQQRALLIAKELGQVGPQQTTYNTLHALYVRGLLAGEYDFDQPFQGWPLTQEGIDIIPNDESWRPPALPTHAGKVIQYAFSSPNKSKD